MKFEANLHFFFINNIILTWKVVPFPFFPSLVFFVLFDGELEKKIQLKMGKLREPKFGHVEAKASSAVPTCGVYLATWPVKKKIFAKKGRHLLGPPCNGLQTMKNDKTTRKPRKNPKNLNLKRFFLSCY